MRSSHVPDIDARYWAIFAVATVFGSNAGDLATEHLARGQVLGVQLPMLALVLGLVLLVERFDPTSSQLSYWFAVALIPMASNDLAMLCATAGVGRGWVIAGLTLVLVVTFLVARSDAMHAVATILMARRRPAVPLTDLSYWTGMLIASVLGTVGSDLLVFNFGLSTAAAAGILTVLAAVLLPLMHWTDASRRFMLYWLNVVTINAAATAGGHFLASDPRLGIGLPLSVLASGGAFGILLLLGERKAHES